MPRTLQPGMCNFPVNMPTEERAVLGRLAFERDMSTGGFVRHLIRVGLATVAPTEAAKVAEIRRTRRAATLAAVFVAALAIHTVEGGFDVLRRANRQTARVQFAPRRTDTQLL